MVRQTVMLTDFLLMQLLTVNLGVLPLIALESFLTGRHMVRLEDAGLCEHSKLTHDLLGYAFWGAIGGFVFSFLALIVLSLIWLVTR